MRLPIIRHISNWIEENRTDSVEEVIDFLEYLIEARGIKEEELDVIGELLSNLAGSLEVEKLKNEGKTQREALNEFMKRVTSIGK